MPLDDLALITKVRNNQDQTAFAELVKRYQSQLRYSLRQLTGWDEALADDLAQETFIKAYRSLQQFRGDAKFFTWLYKIAYHCYIAHHRKYKLEISTAEPPEECDTQPMHRSIDLHRDFSKALLTCSPPQRVALHLHLHKELTHQEIADIMNCPLGTVKSHILRGREKLKTQLACWQNGELR